jgi:hypothetical protein
MANPRDLLLYHSFFYWEYLSRNDEYKADIKALSPLKGEKKQLEESRLRQKYRVSHLAFPRKYSSPGEISDSWLKMIFQHGYARISLGEEKFLNSLNLREKWRCAFIHEKMPGPDWPVSLLTGEDPVFTRLKQAQFIRDHGNGKVLDGILDSRKAEISLTEGRIRRQPTPRVIGLWLFDHGRNKPVTDRIKLFRELSGLTVDDSNEQFYPISTLRTFLWKTEKCILSKKVLPIS